MKVCVTNLLPDYSKLCPFTKQEQKSRQNHNEHAHDFYRAKYHASCTQRLEAFLQDTMGPLLVQLLHASVLNFGGDIESTARRGGEGGRFIDKGEEKSCRIEEDVDAE